MSETGKAAEWPRDPLGLWRWLRGGVIAVMISSCASIATAAYELIARPDIEAAELSANATIWLFASLGVAILYVPAVIYCIILTPRISYRMMRNVREMGTHEDTTSPPWAAGYYFVPFANIVMPAVVLGRIWRATFALSGEERSNSGGLIGLWWGGWVISGGLSNASLRLAGGFSGAPVDPQQYTTSIVLSIVAEAVLLVSSVCMIAVFGKLARVQNTLVAAEQLK